MKIPKKSRKKNPENPKIPGIGIGILKPLKNPEKIPSAKSQKSRNPGDRDRDLKIPKKSRENPEKIPSENPENPKIPGIGIYFFGISRGYPEVVAPKSKRPNNIQRSTFTYSKQKNAKINKKNPKKLESVKK